MPTCCGLVLGNGYNTHVMLRDVCHAGGFKQHQDLKHAMLHGDWNICLAQVSVLLFLSQFLGKYSIIGLLNVQHSWVDLTWNKQPWIV